MTLNNDQFLSMAIAYLEIGRVAAGADTALRRDSEYQNAVAYQLYHAIELFYKYMIINKRGSIKFIHDLAKLEQEYSVLYPGAEFKVVHPFDFTNYEHCELNEGESNLVETHFKNFNPEIMDQHLRYPTDSNRGGYSFSLKPSVFEITKNRIFEVSTLNG